MVFLNVNVGRLKWKVGERPQIIIIIVVEVSQDDNVKLHFQRIE